MDGVPENIKRVQNLNLNIKSQNRKRNLYDSNVQDNKNSRLLENLINVEESENKIIKNSSLQNQNIFKIDIPSLHENIPEEIIDQDIIIIDNIKDNLNEININNQKQVEKN